MAEENTPTESEQPEAAEEEPQETEEENSEETQGATSEGSQRESSEGETGSEGTSEEDEVKSSLEEKLGRQFNSREEALQEIEKMKSLVGDQRTAEDRKKAKEYEKLKQDPNFKALRDEIDQMKFKEQHPEAMDYYDDIKALADARNVSPQEAFENSKFKDLVKNQKQVEATQEENKQSIPNPSEKIASESSDDEEKRAVEKFNEPGANLRDKQDLIVQRLKKSGFFQRQG